jgi:hypothetical protein
MVNSIKKVYDTKYRLKRCDNLIKNLTDYLAKEQSKSKVLNQSKKWRKNPQIGLLIFSEKGFIEKKKDNKNRQIKNLVQQGFLESVFKIKKSLQRSY